MFVENIVIGKPIVDEKKIFSLTQEDWEQTEKEKTYYTQERYLPKVLVDAGVTKSTSEIRRNQPDLAVNLVDLDYLELKWGKRKLFILVGAQI